MLMKCHKCVAAIVAAVCGLASAAEDAPDLSKFTQSYRIPFANKKPLNWDKVGAMYIKASLNGGPALDFDVDTGSVGMIVTASEVPNVDPNGPPGSITYVSSGIELVGIWSKTTVTFPDSKDANGNVATAEIPVLAVTERKVHPGAVNSGVAKPMKNPRVRMFGVGHARGATAHPERNPFVNLKEMEAGTMRRGYTITRDGFTLGLTADNTKGYLFEKLKERPVSDETKAMKPGLRDWRDSTGTVILGPTTQPTTQPFQAIPKTCGMLLDSGLSNFMIELVDAQSQSDIPKGTPVTVKLLGGKLEYKFVVGDESNPATPRKVTWMKYAPGPLINTGVRALGLYDYLLDNDGGYFGLRPTR